MSKKVAMKKKTAFMNNVRDFVYLDTKRYVSLSGLRKFQSALILFIPMTILMGIGGKSAFPIVSIAVWSILYFTFVLILQSKLVKKTFELRFFVNGMCGVWLSSLFWILCSSFSIASDDYILKFDFFMWILPFYLLFTVIYIVVIISGIHNGIYSKVRKKTKSKTAVMITEFAAALLPVSGLIGFRMERLVDRFASVSVKNMADMVVILILLFLPALMHIYFVQYYYCKKYGITCDENGDTSSPALERAAKKTKTR